MAGSGGGVYGWQSLGRLDRKVADLAGRYGGRSKSLGRLVQSIRDLVEADNADRSLRGVDRYGRPLARLLSPRKGRYARASGPPLAPFGARSRIVATFRTAYRAQGDGYVITAGWEGFDDAKGRPIMKYHVEGRGRNPVRNAAGVTPKGWRAINGRIADWKARRD